MNLSKENNTVNLNKPEGDIMGTPVENNVPVTPVAEPVQTPVDAVAEPVVNLNKAGDAPVNNGGFTNPLDKIDLEKVHNMETQAGQAISEGVNNAVDQMQNAFDKASQKFNNFVDGLGNKEQNQNMGPQMGYNPNMNQYGQPTQNMNMGGQNMYGQPNQNMGPQMGYNPNMNQNTGYNPNMNPQQMASMVTPDKLKVEPAIAALLSFLLTGLGQMVNGQVEKGLTLLFGGMAAVFIITLITCGIGAITAPVVIIVSIIDAYKCAQILQSGRPIGKWEFHIFD